MDEHLRVLYFTHHGPWPATSGGRVRDAALIPEVARLAEVEVWAVSRSPDLDRASLRSAPRGTTVRIFGDESRRRRYPTRDSAAARSALSRHATGSAAFDVVHVEGHYLYHLLPEPYRERAVVVEHNIESHLLRQRAGHYGLDSGLARDIEAVAREEEHVWRQVPLVLTLSEEDRARILRRVHRARVCLSTNGADHVVRAAPTGHGDVRAKTTPVHVGFLANYAYPPNRDALGWLLDDILPALRELLPDCRLVLAGSNLDGAVDGRRLPPYVDATGWVDDLARFWSQIDLLLCPLRIGGGVKVKMIEAVRSGALAVSTSVGLEGLPPAAREAIVRADTVQDFVAAAHRLSTDRSFRDAQHARLVCAQEALATWTDVAHSLYRQWLSIGRTVLGGVVGT